MIFCIIPIWRVRAFLCALLLLFMAATSARGELPSARLLSIFPPGAKQGSTVEVTVTGQDLDDLSALHFSNARITAKAAGGANKFQVTVPPEVPLGMYDVRAIGRYGVSNPRTFVVGNLAEVVNKPGNTSIATAVAISPGQTISAAVDANSVQYHKLSLKKGQRIFAEIAAREIDSRLEPSIVLADANGNDRVISRRGELIDYTALADGDYYLKIYDFTYRGGADFFYRLSVSSGPRIEFVFPPAGVAGTKSKYTIYGRNLPGGTAAMGRFVNQRGLEQLAVEIELPAQPPAGGEAFSLVPSSAAFMDGFEYRLNAPNGISNPVRIGFATAPVVLREQDAASSSEAQFQKLAVPCEVAGRFVPRSAPQGFTFDAPANSVFWIEVISSRLGNPTAPFLLVQRVAKDDKGAEKISDIQEVYESPANTGGPEFRTSSRDPVYRLETKEAGTYRVIVRDLFTTPTDDAGLVYRLSIRKESPDFRLVAFAPSPVAEKDSKDAPISTPLLRRGGVTPIKVVALRQDNFAGEIQLKVEGLPAGVTCAPATIAASTNTVTLLLSAADDAQAGFGALKISGTSMLAGANVAREARPGTVSTSSYDTQNKAVEIASRRARELFVAVAPEAMPLQIVRAKNEPLETCVFNKISIPVKIVRKGEITGPIPLKLMGHPLLAPVKEVTIDPGKDSATLDLDLAQIKLPPGVYDLGVETLAKVKYRANAEAAKEADAAAKAAEKAGVESAGAAKTAAAALAALKPDAPQRAEAEKASNEAAKKAKDAEAAKVAAAARAKDLNAKAAPKDIAASFYSLPITLTITSAPIKIAPPAAVSIEAGNKTDLSIKLTRLYGFADVVDLAVVAPNVKGVSGKVSLAKDKSDGALAIQTDAATPVGEHAVKLEVKVKVGGQTITVEQPMTIKVVGKVVPSKNTTTTQATTKPK